MELAGLAIARDGRTVLSGVDATIRQGQFVGIFGPNGSGKTTLLRAILGLIRPAAGAIRVLGGTPGRGNPNAGYLPQERSSVAGLNICGRDFVAGAYRGNRWGLPLPGREGRDEVQWALSMTEAEDLAARPVSRLSGGELQRLLLAQALLGHPKLLLLDEPLMNLDPRYQRSVIELVKQLQLKLGATVLLSAHELNPLLEVMDGVLYLGNGQGAFGPVESVITSEVLSRLYATPIEVVHLGARIFVMSAHGNVEADAHHHHA